MTDFRTIEFEHILTEYAGRRRLAAGYSDDDVFALFVTENLIADEVVGTPDAELIFVDGAHDTGIDGLGIVIDSQLVGSVEMARDLLARRPGASAIRFIMVQVTRERQFRAIKVEKFVNGVANFFREQLAPAGHAALGMARNRDVQAAADIKNEVFALIREHGHPAPVLHMHYASLGRCEPHGGHQRKRAQGVARLAELDLFGAIEFDWTDFSGILALRRRFRARNIGELGSARMERLTEGRADGIAYLGSISADDLISLVEDRTTGGINKFVFLENVRDRLPDTPVNAEIAATIDRGDLELFPLLSNGVTIVCRHLENMPGSLRLHDYQIVNGCQTSHVVHDRQKLVLGRNMQIPAKVVVSRDPLVVRRIIEASNRQSAITPENLLALQPFNRALADYFEAMRFTDAAVPLHYELREGELEASDAADELCISVRDQIQAYGAMVLRRPHDVIDGTRDFVAAAGRSIFGLRDFPEVYYAAALALARWRQFAARAPQSGVLGRRPVQQWMNARFAALFAIGQLAFGEKPDVGNRTLMVARAEVLRNALESDRSLEIILGHVAALLDDAAGRGNALAPQLVNKAAFTKKVAAACLLRPLDLTALAPVLREETV